MKNNTAKEYAIITFGAFLVALGVYLFKFPNNFAFGGVTGFATVVAKLTPLTASTVSMILNILFMILGWIFLGKDCGLKTVYGTLVFTAMLSAFEWIFPMSGPLTHQPILELIYAIAVPAAGSALLFRLDSSTGGTEVLAMIMKKYSSLNIGMALLCTDAVLAASSFFVFGVETGLFSLVGLVVKSLIIDSMIASMNRNKYFTIVCSKPDLIVDYINNTLHHGSTQTGATGSYTGSHKTIIYAAVKTKETRALVSYVKKVDPHAFLFIQNSSEIIGKGFLSH
ncbi:YitT family protein [Cuneatibacter sp. NSJ-177]|uniref:YitT family protein n=1 Tax=Cuneatibacter sp. NSJ-177 TaxID=2931401 RepID=UPI001FD56372|nr:YitT family protein [Cuneatibacter sp. NSJ-177]MCJ7833854.1 YitT family protein [Cuneatibacter sp. NSJ-177]